MILERQNALVMMIVPDMVSDLPFGLENLGTCSRRQVASRPAVQE